jgi:calcium-dependent protein kinase
MVNEGEVRQLMSAIDLNRDGSLQDSEFLATMIDWPAVMREGGGDGGAAAAAGGAPGGEWEGYVAAAFSRLDRDGDGFIDLEELLAELPPAYLSPARASASSVNNSPGNSPGSSRDGAAAAATVPSAELLAEAERERVAEAKRMLRECDENGDGKISREEFSNLLRQSVRDDLALYDSRRTPESSRDEQQQQADARR